MSGRVRGPRRRIADTVVAPWWWAADLAVLGGMVVLGSVLLIPAYGNPAPVLAAATGALVAAGVLMLIRRSGLPGWVSAAGVAVGVVVLGSLVVAPELRKFGVLPSFAGMTTVLRGVLVSWRDLLTVTTPTGVVGALLVPPLLIGAVATALAGVVADTRRSAAALLFPATAMVLFALFGNRQVPPAVVGLISGLFLAAGMGWVVWVGSRANRRALTRRGRRAKVNRLPARSTDVLTWQALAPGRTMTSVAVLAVAGVLGALIAASAPAPRTALRELVELPVAPAAFTSPLSAFRSYIRDQADVVQLSATGLPAGARLRLAALDAYDGRQFVISDGEGPFVRIGRQPADEVGGQPTSVTVVVRNYAGLFLPLPGPIDELDFAGPRAGQLAEDLRYSASAATGLLPGGWQPGDRYTVLAAVPPQPTPAELASVKPIVTPFPSTVALPDLLRSAANQYVAGVSGAAAQVAAIQAGLAADGLFSNGGPGEPRSAAGHGLDRMSAMVTGTRMVGNQEQYAALMTLMVRSLGLPARVAVGFVPPSRAVAGAAVGGAAVGGDAVGGDAVGGDSGSGVVDLRGRDISAWVEVPFEGYGWVAFDPSPSPVQPLTDAQERSPAQRRAVTAGVPPALPQPQPDAVDAQGPNQRPDTADSNVAAPAENPVPASLPVMILGWLAVLLVLIALPVGVILGLKGARRRRRRGAEQPRDQITGGWEQLLDTAVDSGYRPSAWHTRSEIAADLQASGVLQVDWLAPAADAAEFSPDPVNPEGARGYWREVDDRGAELLDGLPRWRRWRARLSLASIRRADRRAVAAR